MWPAIAMIPLLFRVKLHNFVMTIMACLFVAMFN